MQRGRSLSGEIRGVFSELILRRDLVSETGIASSELTNILGLFVLVAAVQKIALDATSDELCSSKCVADYVGSQVSLYRPLNTPIPFQDVSGLVADLANYRLLTNAFFDSV